MAKKKKTSKQEEKPSSPFSALDKQVLNNETLTIADVKQFIIDAKKKREDWLNIADRSWNEIKKRNRKGKLYGGNDLDRARRWARFPLWWSCLQIRKPITLARLPIPVLKDTQGDDPYGRTACIVGERLTRGILKTFDAFDEFAASNDDFLVTDFGWGRAFYKKEECYEEEKIRLEQAQPPMLEQIEGQPPPEPQPPIFINPITGEQELNPLFDEFGPYVKSGAEIIIDNEQVYFEAGLYSNLYVDDVRRWNKVTRLAFEYQYSYREFKEKFGQAALDKLARGDIEEHRMGKPIICFEYHDKFLKEVRWFAENSEDFFQPKEMSYLNTNDLEEVKEEKVDHSDLYGLSNFFPCTEPLIINNPTDEFWPTPEFFQVNDLIEDIHSIVSRMSLLTKAIRVRFFFDSSIPQLKQLVGETGEGGGLGIPNLEAALMNAKGKLSNLVAYFPVDEMIQGLNNMYAAFEQRLNMFYQVTGLSDLLRGQTTDGDKTFGERQLEGKFALNRIEPRQRKVQEWIKNNYQLLMEMALKMFSDKSLDEYITPQTLDEEDKQRYEAALELLRANKRSRFRVDFETDSTIAINQQWKKQQAIELANTLTKAMESVANVAETQPELASTELSVLRHLIGEFSDGKLFVDEIQDSIQKVIDKVSQPQEPGFDKDQANFQLEQQRLQFEQQRAVFQDQSEQQNKTAEQQFKQLELQANNRLEIAKIQQQERFNALENQLTQIKLQNEAGLASAELGQKAQQLQADIALAQEELISKRQEFLLQAQEIASKTEAKQLELVMDARVAEQKKQLEELYFQLEQEKVLLSEKEKYMTEQRLQAEHQLNTLMSVTELHKSLKEIKEAPPAPITVHVQAPAQPKAKKKRARIVRDATTGLATDIEIDGEDE